MLNRILGGKVRGKHRKYGIRKCRRERKYMGGKGKIRMCKEVCWMRACSTGFWEGKCGTKREGEGIEGSAEM